MERIGTGRDAQDGLNRDLWRIRGRALEGQHEDFVVVGDEEVRLAVRDRRGEIWRVERAEDRRIGGLGHIEDMDPAITVCQICEIPGDHGPAARSVRGSGRTEEDGRGRNSDVDDQEVPVVGEIEEIADLGGAVGSGSGQRPHDDRCGRNAHVDHSQAARLVTEIEVVPVHG